MLVDRIVKWLLPRENQFFLYLNNIAKNVHTAADTFGGLRNAQGPEDFHRIAVALRRQEHDTDEIAHLLYEALDKTFVTPIDREDLHALTYALDDIVDLMESSANQIVLYKLQRMTEPMRELVRVAESAANEVAESVQFLQKIGNGSDINLHIIRVNSLENEGDKIYRRALENLFDSKMDPLELIREKEIISALESAIDACEDVMDLARSVLVKKWLIRSSF